MRMELDKLTLFGLSLPHESRNDPTIFALKSSTEEIIKIVVSYNV